MGAVEGASGRGGDRLLSAMRTNSKRGTTAASGDNLSDIELHNQQVDPSVTPRLLLLYVSRSQK